MQAHGSGTARYQRPHPSHPIIAAVLETMKKVGLGDFKIKEIRRRYSYTSLRLPLCTSERFELGYDLRGGSSPSLFEAAMQIARPGESDAIQ